MQTIIFKQPEQNRKTRTMRLLSVYNISITDRQKVMTCGEIGCRIPMIGHRSEDDCKVKSIKMTSNSNN